MKRVARDEVERLSWVLERLVRRLRAEAAASGLSPSIVSMLTALDHEGPTRVTPLARRLGISQPAATQLVTRLVDDGLAERRTTEGDRRAVEVALTDAGRDTIAARRAGRATTLAILLDALGDDDRVAVLQALGPLERLAAAAEANDGVEAVGAG